MSDQRTRSLNEEIRILQEAVTGLPRATAAHVHQALSEGLHPVAELKPSVMTLARSIQALSSQLEAVSPEVRKLMWHLEKPTVPTFLGWDREEWTWLGAMWLTDAATEARERETQAREGARREREQERQRERDRDEDLEWER